jgi:hypothetical protein
MITSKQIETWWPYALGALAAAGSLPFFSFWYPSKPNELVQSALTIGAISVGFLANMKAILFSVEKTRIVEDLKASGYWNDLIDYLMDAIHVSLLLVLFGAVGFLFDCLDRSSWFVRLILSAWVFLLVSAVSAYYRVVRLLAFVLRGK